MQKSFIKRIASGSDRVWEISVPSTLGARAFYRLAVHPLKEAAFRKAWKEGRTVNLADYGDVIESGYIPNEINENMSEAV